MEIVLIAIALILAAGVGLHLFKRHNEARARQLKEREYEAALALWHFGRDVRDYLNETARLGTGVLDFRKIVVPHCKGYKVLIEFIGYAFRIYALPDHHAKSGRLSFYLDNSLTLRAADRNGERATEQDEEYTGDFNQ
jgi:hypothetical protein